MNSQILVALVFGGTLFTGALGFAILGLITMAKSKGHGWTIAAGIVEVLLGGFGMTIGFVLFSSGLAGLAMINWHMPMMGW